MANKFKEDEKIERAIRGLMKLPENRRCINCKSMGPQYVCTNFWTFICTTCSGIHREFTHRVKSISMSKFTLDEVSALQAGGNEQARQKYFKNWDAHRNSQPDDSNLFKLRDFIKHVYVDQKFTDEKITDEKIPSRRLTDKEESGEVRRSIVYRTGITGSPNYEERYDRGYRSTKSSPGARSDDGVSRYYYNDNRSPNIIQHSSRSFKRSPARFEVVDDRFRDDDNGGRLSGNIVRLTSEDFKAVGRRSLDEPRRNAEMLPGSLEARLKSALSRQYSQPVIKQDGNEGKEAKAPSNDQKVSSLPKKFSSTGDIRSKQEKVGDQGSAMICYHDSKPSDIQPQPTHPPPIPISTAATKNDGKNWASFGSSAEDMKTPKKQPKPNTLEFLLFELSGPPLLPGPSSNEVPYGADRYFTEQHVTPVTDQHVTPTTEQNVTPETKQKGYEAPMALLEPESIHPLNAEPLPDTLITQPFEENADVLDTDAYLMQFPVSQQNHQPPALVPEDNMSAGEYPNPKVSPASPIEAMTEQQLESYHYPAQDVSIVELESNSPVASQSPQHQRNLSGRSELPADLFTTLYRQAPPAPAPTWHSAPSQGFGFNMHYYPPNTMQLPAYSNTPKSTNPFEVEDEETEHPVSSFPQTLPTQGPLFNSTVPSPFDQFSLRQQPSSMMQPQSRHAQAYSPGFYMGQHHGQNSIPFQSQQQPQEYEGFGGNPNHQMVLYPGPATPNYSYPSSIGSGNPFS